MRMTCVPSQRHSNKRILLEKLEQSVRYAEKHNSGLSQLVDSTEEFNTEESFYFLLDCY